MMHSQATNRSKFRRVSRGFTLTEILMAGGIFSIFLVIVGTFYFRGNKAATKAAWRTHTAAQLRMTLKLMEQAFEKTAYPTYTSTTDFDELESTNADAIPFKVTIGDGSVALTPSAPITLTASDTKGLVLSFATAIPYSIGADGSTASGGITTAYTFFFNDEEAELIPNTTHAYKTLMYSISGGEYTYSSGTFSGVDSFPTVISPEKPLLNHVNEITFSMLPKPANENIHKATIQVDISCRDPLDGRHVVSQTMLHMVHTDTNP